MYLYRLEYLVLWFDTPRGALSKMSSNLDLYLLEIAKPQALVILMKKHNQVTQVSFNPLLEEFP